MNKASERNRRWRQRHPDKYRAIYQSYNRKRYRADPQGEKERVKKWQAENPEKVKEYKRRWRERHTEEIRAQSKSTPEEIRESWRRWEEANPERKRDTWRKGNRTRRAKIASTFNRLTAEDEQETLEHGCFLCGDKENLQVAHDIPIGPIGPTTRANTLCLCKSCNVRMGRKSLAETIEQIAF